MTRSQYEGALQALFQSPPFRKLSRAVDGAEGDMIRYTHSYLKKRISEALWGDNMQRYQRFLDERERRKKT